MRLFSCIGICLGTALAVLAGGAQGEKRQSLKALWAPTYYIAAEVNDCEPNPNYVAFRGASNLPPGAIISAVVTDFDFDAWKDYSERVFVPVTDQGFFSGKILPKDGMGFRHNLILRLVFGPIYAKQPASVLAVVGRKGENLGGVEPSPIEDIAGRSENPQLFQTSGWYYGLETIARVPHCGEK